MTLVCAAIPADAQGMKGQEFDRGYWEASGDPPENSAGSGGGVLKVHPNACGL